MREKFEKVDPATVKTNDWAKPKENSRIGHEEAIKQVVKIDPASLDIKF